MLGYVKADKQNLTIGDYEIYRGIYCSLCKALGRNYSVFARAFLSYDFTLAALLRLSVLPDECVFDRSRCPFNPAKTCWYCRSTAEFDFCSHCVIIIAYYKILDDLHDRGIFKKLLALLLFPMISLMHKKAKRFARDIDTLIGNNMLGQAQAEKDPDTGIDEAAHFSADSLGAVFSAGSDPETAENMYRIGYLTGRLVYILDAADDLGDDIKSGNFNPLKKEFPDLDSAEEKQKFILRAEKLLNHTQAQLLEETDKADFKRFGVIIENIFSGGLERSAKSALMKYTDNPSDKQKSFTVK